ncbi:elongation factor P maturation arginine rhamnosyltransferase EarP [Niveibacterium umoris]|uniref:Protein-arginine rhamnosyltransferase n=1 Tax=Niveibacterium umoris TaxID=1193620 RepID=A0A840BMU7_9RHOO|nr:elongation factor P maturation arginine rhamnosyltransferase EarP [Niveibacterium umoris]MBB4012878.1 putative repeat protein (TIGR03837 family) [Niveibacterium umoris]
MTEWRWDIFCTVIDNYGDIGVCWRLARQLASEHRAEVRLWVDDLASCRRLLGMCADDGGTPQPGVVVCHWRPGSVPEALADVVVAGFTCRLPEAYLAAMAARARPPVWITLEYLSAEDWVEGCHLLPSPHPRLALTEFFFYPGFTAKTGGLLREAGLIEARERFRADAAAQAENWALLGTDAPAPEALRVSLFAYENPAVASLLATWAEGGRAVWCGVPEGRIWQSVAQWLGQPLETGGAVRRGNLTLAPLAFVDQPAYDRLLWSCDLNFVRGEDSFVRAQWAGRPFIWHIYPQDDAAHLVKLDAFLDRYVEGLAQPDAAAVRRIQHAWNAGADMTQAWADFGAALPSLNAHADAWCAQQAAAPDLASVLAQFTKTKLK